GARRRGRARAESRPGRPRPRPRGLRGGLTGPEPVRGPRVPAGPYRFFSQSFSGRGGGTWSVVAAGGLRGGISRLDGGERFEDLIGVPRPLGHDPRVARLELDGLPLDVQLGAAGDHVADRLVGPRCGLFTLAGGFILPEPHGD